MRIKTKKNWNSSPILHRSQSCTMNKIRQKRWRRKRARESIRLQVAKNIEWSKKGVKALCDVAWDEAESSDGKRYKYILHLFQMNNPFTITSSSTTNDGDDDTGLEWEEDVWSVYWQNWKSRAHTKLILWYSKKISLFCFA